LVVQEVFAGTKGGQ